jgi:hypothetical protein
MFPLFFLPHSGYMPSTTSCCISQVLQYCLTCVSCRDLHYVLSYIAYFVLFRSSIFLSALILYVCNFYSSLKVRGCTLHSNRTAGRIIGFYALSLSIVKNRQGYIILYDYTGTHYVRVWKMRFYVNAPTNLNRFQLIAFTLMQMLCLPIEGPGEKGKKHTMWVAEEVRKGRRETDVQFLWFHPLRLLFGKQLLHKLWSTCTLFLIHDMQISILELRTILTMCVCAYAREREKEMVLAYCTQYCMKSCAGHKWQ